ncbi:MAG: hypothetical protein JNL08_03280 [Planctomycetes bacterium]|nr:hypothetical protein [Planctomycetota bacterium]
MSGRPPRAEVVRRLVRAAAAIGATLAVVLLAPLAAGAHSAAPPTAAELAALDAALADGPARPAAGGEVTRHYFRSIGGGAPLPADPADRERVLGQARLRQLPWIGAIAGATYLAVLLARGRLQALLACALLAALPPVAEAGALVRAEVPATALLSLSLLLLACFAGTVQRRDPARGRRRGQLLGLGLCAAVALALSVSALPSLGAVVLLPGLVVTVGGAMLGLRALRLVHRRGLTALPIRAWNARLVPWTALALVAPAVVIVVLRLAATGETTVPATPSAVGLLPAGAGWRTGVWALAAVGALAAVLRTGLRFGRGGRFDADLLLLVYCALELSATIGQPGPVDRLPAAPALAIVLAEGARVVVVVLAWFVAGRPRPRWRGPGAVLSGRRRGR